MTLPTSIADGDPGFTDHHNEIHDLLPEGILPTGLVEDVSTGHRAHHEKLHRMLPGLGLPIDVRNSTAADHENYHEIIHTWFNAQSPVGIRGTVGPRDPALIPEYPTSGLVTVAPGAGTIQAAITANGDGTKFQLQAGTYSLNSYPNPKTGQEFWGEEGVTITGGGTRDTGFKDVGDTPDVKIMNCTFTGFVGGTYNDRAAIMLVTGATSSTDWEIAYNEISGDTTNGRYAIHGGSADRLWVHHNKLHDFKESCINGFESDDCVSEDNELYNAGLLNGQKWVKQTRNTVRHNHIHDMNNTSCWHDFNNTGCVIEWNLIEDGPGGDGVELEISGSVPTNYVRFNHIRNVAGSAVFLSSASHTEIYGNRLENNGAIIFVGDACEIHMFVKQVGIDQGHDLKNNYAHDNFIHPRTDGSHAKGSQMNFTPSDLPTDQTPYLTNTKNNVWNHNTYELLSVGAGNHFRWGTTAQTWATWRGNLTPSGTQDILSTAT